MKCLHLQQSCWTAFTSVFHGESLVSSQFALSSAADYALVARSTDVIHKYRRDSHQASLKANILDRVHVAL